MSEDKLEIEKLFNTTGVDDSIKGDWYIIQLKIKATNATFN